MMPLLLQASTDPTIKWALIALAAGTIIYAVVIRPAMKKKDPLRKSPPSPFSSGRLAQQRDTERQMQNLLVELSEMARQITAQLDTRSQKLEILIHQADERLAALRQVMDQRPSQRLDVQPEVFRPRETFSVREPDPPRALAVSDTRHEDIYTLADQGRAAGDIARELNRPRGEVELILALRPRG